MSEYSEYSDYSLQVITSGEILPKRNRNKLRAIEEELEKEGRIDSEEHRTPNIDFNGDPKFACHLKTELSRVTMIKLMNAINDMLEHRPQELLKPPYSIEVTEGDDKNHVKVHIIFNSFNCIEPDDKKGASCDT